MQLLEPKINLTNLLMINKRAVALQLLLMKSDSHALPDITIAPAQKRPERDRPVGVGKSAVHSSRVCPCGNTLIYVVISANALHNLPHDLKRKPVNEKYFAMLLSCYVITSYCCLLLSLICSICYPFWLIIIL